MCSIEKDIHKLQKEKMGREEQTILDEFDTVNQISQTLKEAGKRIFKQS